MAEEPLDEREAAARAFLESEERFRTIFEHAPVMVDSFDDSGRCVLWNPECERRLGWTQHEMSRMSDPLSVFYPDPKSKERVRRAIEEADGRFREYDVLAKDGSVRIQLWANFRLPTGALIAVGHDVTEQRATEAQLRQSQKLEAVGRLSGGIAHDFNNLLTVVLGNAEILDRHIPAGATTMRQALAELRDAASRGAELVNQLTTFSRRSRLTLTTVDLEEVVERITPTLRRLLPESVEVVWKRGHVACFVDADAIAIEQILVNLATNARDSIAGHGRIEIRTECLPDGIVLTVGDDGAGVDPEVRDRIFEPFFTTKPPGRGTGLGLSMVDGLVRQHGGSIEVWSEPGRGSRFEIHLPRSSGERPPPARVSSRPTTTPRGERILVVEDEAAIRDVAFQTLRDHGYEVLMAADGQEALAILARETHVDMILSDVVMPRMGGGELLARVSDRVEGGMVFAFTSGYASEDSLAVVPEHTPILRKPWSGVQLADFVRRCLDDDDGARDQ